MLRKPKVGKDGLTPDLLSRLEIHHDELGITESEKARMLLAEAIESNDQYNIFYMRIYDARCTFFFGEATRWEDSYKKFKEILQQATEAAENSLEQCWVYVIAEAAEQLASQCCVDGNYDGFIDYIVTIGTWINKIVAKEGIQNIDRKLIYYCLLYNEAMVIVKLHDKSPHQALEYADNVKAICEIPSHSVAFYGDEFKRRMYLLKARIYKALGNNNLYVDSLKSAQSLSALGIEPTWVSYFLEKRF